jgi:hypothetical protein
MFFTSVYKFPVRSLLFFQGIHAPERGEPKRAVRINAILFIDSQYMESYHAITFNANIGKPF